MKKPIRFIFTLNIFIYLIILISSCPNQHRYYVALGDSVSAGYGLAAHEKSYPSIFFELLENDGYADDYLNLGVNGFTTTTLLEYLKNLDNEKLSIIAGAQVITLNIGGNNILVPFSGYFSELVSASGADSIRSGTGSIISGARNIISGIRSGVGSTGSDPNENRDAVSGVISGIGNIITGIGSLIAGTGEVISGSPGILNTLSGSFSPELNNRLENGVRSFSEEFIEIITWIKRRAPRAVIIVNTIYNPIPQDILRSSMEFSLAANVLIESMNNIIIQGSKSIGYLVTDTYTHFSNQLNMMGFNMNPFAGDMSFDIVHPNAEGHKLIAQLNYETFLQR